MPAALGRTLAAYLTPDRSRRRGRRPSLLLRPDDTARRHLRRPAARSPLARPGRFSPPEPSRELVRLRFGRPRPRGRGSLPHLAAPGPGGPRGYRRADDLARDPGLRPRRGDPGSHDAGKAPPRRGARRRPRPRHARPHRRQPDGLSAAAVGPARPARPLAAPRGRGDVPRHPRRAPALRHRPRHLARKPRRPALRRAPHPAERGGHAGAPRARRSRRRGPRPLACARRGPPISPPGACWPASARTASGRTSRTSATCGWRSASPTPAAGTTGRTPDAAEPAPGVDARRGPLRRLRRPRLRWARRPAPRRPPRREARRRARVPRPRQGRVEGLLRRAGSDRHRRVRLQRRRPPRLHRPLRRAPADPAHRGGRGPRRVGGPLRALRRGGGPREGRPLEEAAGPGRRVDLPRAGRAARPDRVRRRRRRHPGAGRGAEGRRRGRDRDRLRPQREARPLAEVGAGAAPSEELDTDGDGKPDRRLVFGSRARLVRVERLPR